MIFSDFDITLAQWRAAHVAQWRAALESHKNTYAGPNRRTNWHTRARVARLVEQIDAGSLHPTDGAGQMASMLINPARIDRIIECGTRYMRTEHGWSAPQC